jgi:hypothetical protein
MAAAAAAAARSLTAAAAAGGIDGDDGDGNDYHHGYGISKSNHGDDDDDDDDDDNDDGVGDDYTEYDRRGRQYQTDYTFDDWVGVGGVDLFEVSRSRKAYVRPPYAITANNFLFPVCHDRELYGKCRQLQQLKRTIEPFVVGYPSLQQLIKQEAKASLRENKRKRLVGPNAGDPDGQSNKKKKSSPGEEENEKDDAEKKSSTGGKTDDVDVNIDDDEVTDSEDEDGVHGATWPGIDSIVPVHMLKDFM